MLSGGGDRSETLVENGLIELANGQASYRGISGWKLF